MTSKTLRRRLRHGDVDGRGREHLESSDFDGLDEPLLGNYDSDNNRHSEVGFEGQSIIKNDREFRFIIN